MIDKILETIHSNLEHWMLPDNLRLCLSCMDLTTLNTTDTQGRIISFVEKINGFGAHFPMYAPPAAVCVYPKWGGVVKRTLAVPDVKVAVVAGGFPNSQTFPQVKLLECKMAMEQGADEVDIVMPLNLYLAGERNATADEISMIKECIGEGHLKVILETGALCDVDKIKDASLLAMEAGADFIKTSTGKQEPAATPVAAIAMCQSIKEFYEKTGRKVGFKPAGGISTAKDAISYLAIVETILGREWLNPRLFRIGASRLANNLLSELEQQTIGYF